MDSDICQVYEDEIQSLKEEIKLLSKKYEDSQQESTYFSDKEILMSVKSLQRELQGESEGHESAADLQAQLESLETDLSFLMKLTGIQFTGLSKKTLERTGNKTVRKYRLSGSCCSLSFQLEFQLLEMQNKGNVSAAITDLSITMEPRGNSDLDNFVSSEKCGSLLTFFRSLSSYAEWYEHRRCTFLHFKEKYPDIVSLPEGLLGDYILLRNPKASGFELMIVWKIHINEKGKTTPVLDLLTKVPKQVLDQKMAAIENAPTRFRSMLLVVGIEEAIENLVNIFVSER
ncbi:centromere protein P isoform X2 [Melopsittacus undulatus]|uniref:centromere protein P isoform X2 n=1 Tax=Melopsittacus undulatus TaxID=13146 RepID=UPI00146DEC5A|nr:centromere protein P isoform X2 [Melopsittacus undulatus]